MSELYTANSASDSDAPRETDRPAPADTEAEAHTAEEELPTRQETWESARGDAPQYYTNDDIDAAYTEEGPDLANSDDQIPTRQEAWDTARDDGPQYYTQDDIDAAYAEDQDAVLEQHDAPPIGAGQADAADTQEDTAASAATDTDAEAKAMVADEQRLPEPRSQQEAATNAWDDTTDLGDTDPFSGHPVSGDDGELPDGSRPGVLAASETAGSEAPAPGGDAQSAVRGDELSSDQARVTVHDQYGHDVPITVIQSGPEGHTLGDEAADGAGLKPTGEQLLRMESDDPAESRADQFFDKIFERMDDVHDATSDIAQAVQEDLPHGSAQQPSPGYIGYVVHDQPIPPPDSPGTGDMVANLAVVAVMTTVGLRHLFGHNRKGRQP